MPSDCIPFKDTNYFSPLICDYLDQSQELEPFYHRFPILENFENQITEKQNSYTKETRSVLVDALKKQYAKTQTSQATLKHLEYLAQSNTFTVTTGHQLNLFTGPLYFLYKIVSAINLAKDLRERYPSQNIVPVYWMATEDHDFEEINFFNFKGQVIQWTTSASGGVGRLNTDGLQDVFRVFAAQLGPGQNANYIQTIFEEAYLKQDNLADATRYIANALFGAYGLVIIDGDDVNLKRVFIPYVERELKEKISYKKVLETNAKIQALVNKDYPIQVNPRAINLFYLNHGIRERIIEENGVFRVNNTEISFSESELLKVLNEYPDRFSPNVVMRPLYQEVILPNLCYIGGGGEIAYWLQLKSYFNTVEVPFPILLLRNSALIMTEKQSQKLQKLGLTVNDMFKKQLNLVNERTKALSNISIDFSEQKAHLQKQFKSLYALAEETDFSFLRAVAAQERKQIKGLEHLEKRLLKAQKRKLADVLVRTKDLQDELFPRQSLQERNTNFSEFYLEHGDVLIEQLVLNLQPLLGEFLILEI
ncbi:MAG: bacillithiol biosynthesis cysteine-adding enzyme BshC [Flavobacteriaceae bacterium]|nr:bacillithiol biosynthesis cysteine-adding enzyme BshC [Flavobacteriaceae bacterium]